MPGNFLVVLPLFAILLAAAYRRNRGPGAPVPTWRQRLVFGLAMFAIVFPAIGIAARGSSGAEIPAEEWFASLVALAAVGVAPLAIFFAFDVPLRFVRR
jgi:predicted cobalt transporter CbtA